MEQEDKFYFVPGMLVTLKQDIPNKPIMIVDKKKSATIRDGKDSTKILQGIVCKWFTTDGFIQEATFSTKDLQIVD